MVAIPMTTTIKPIVCPGCKNGVRIPPYGIWRCPHCGYVLIGKTNAR
jgi:ribosomal protein L37AE/L43A